MPHVTARAAREGLGVDGDSDRWWHELILAESLHKKALGEIAWIAYTADTIPACVRECRALRRNGCSAIPIKR